MAKKTKKEDDLFGSIPPPEEFNAFPSIPFPDEMISSLTTPESKKDTPKVNAKNMQQKGRQNGIDKCHGQMTLPNGISDKHVSETVEKKVKEENQKKDTTNSIDRNIRQVDMLDGIDNWQNQMTSPNDVTKQPNKIAWHINEPPLLKTKNQKRLFNYLKRHGSMITTIGNLAKKTKISSRTVQRILTLFEDVGYIVKEKYINGDIQGIKIIVLDRMKQEGKVSYNKRPKQDLSTLSNTDQKTPSEILIKEKVLTLTQDDLKRFFSYLADAGFDSQQIKEINKCLKKLDEKL